MGYVIAGLSSTLVLLGAFLIFGASRRRSFDHLGFILDERLGGDLYEQDQTMTKVGRVLGRYIGVASDDALEQTMKLLGTTSGQFYFQKVFQGLSYGAATFGVINLFTLTGVRTISAFSMLLFTAIAFVAGFTIPDLRLRTQVERRRNSFLIAFATYLELIVVRLQSSDTSPSSTMQEVSSVCDGWAFDLIGEAVDQSRYGSAEPPWVYLRTLGQEFDLEHVVTWANQVQSANTTGANILNVTQTRVDEIRRDTLRHLQTASSSKITSAFGPVMLMAAVIAVFVLYASFASLPVNNVL